MTVPLRIGFIPLVDAAALIVAVDKGFTAAEGLDVTLVREVSWSNVRDKLNLGLFEAAHLLAPVAIASSLGLGHVKVPIAASFNLGLNGNAITVSPALHAAIMAEIDGDRFHPMATATALARVVANRHKSGAEPLTFGMTFPFSTHNYQLRFWMAAGGVDPDVILIDLENPSRDVLEQMFQVSRAVRRPIAMFVDQSDAASIQASVDAGVSAYIVDGLKKERIKPILDLCISRFNAFSKLQDELDRTKSALEERKVIDRAKGILMKVKGLTEDEAYVLMRSTAMREKKKIGEIAQSILTASELLK